MSEFKTNGNNFERLEVNSFEDNESAFQELKKHFLRIEKRSLDELTNTSNPEANLFSNYNLTHPQNAIKPLIFSQDWPNHNDEWEENAHRKIRKRQSTFPSKQRDLKISFSQNEVIHKDLERTRKKMLATARIKGCLSESFVTNNTLHISTEPLSREDSTSIVGSRPLHWVANSHGSIFKDIINSQAIKSSSKLGKVKSSNIRLPLQVAVNSCAPFSLKSNFTNNSLTKLTSKKIFIPNAFTKVMTNSIELNENESSVSDRYKDISFSKTVLGSIEKGRKTTSKKKTSPGPLVQRFHALRAERNADILRLRSRLSLQDPRRNKPFVDLNLWKTTFDGQTTSLSTTTELWGRYLAFPCKAYEDNYMEPSLCWVLLEQSPMKQAGLLLRVYNPVIISMQDGGNSCVSKVIICTQFHEWLEQER
jgi:hypothetical protein